jgi:hypothetical protein
METFLKYKEQDLDLIYQNFLTQFNNDNLLVRHRNYIKKNNLGYGEDPFHVIWREIVKSQHANFKFLEIGVYKGQVLSLVKLLSENYNKNVKLLGVSPLDNVGDKYSVYDKIDYKETILKLFEHFELSIDFNSDFIEGQSTDEDVKNRIKEKGLFDVVYIDGCHDYDCVVSDIKLIHELTKIGSILVMDDSSCFKDIKRYGAHKGHYDVCKAINDMIESNDIFEEIICVGHNRVFKKIK